MNAAQAWNHDFYWNSLAPEGKGGEPSSALKAAIGAAFWSWLAESELRPIPTLHRSCFAELA